MRFTQVESPVVVLLLYVCVGGGLWGSHHGSVRTSVSRSSVREEWPTPGEVATPSQHAHAQQAKARSEQDERDKVQMRLKQHKVETHYATRDGERDARELNAKWDEFKVQHLRQKRTNRARGSFALLFGSARSYHCGMCALAKLSHRSRGELSHETLARHGH